MSEKKTCLDLDHLAAMTMGDAAIAVEVLEIFKGQAETWGRMLDATAPQTQWADAAHTLKGAALGIGAMALADVCKRAEDIGRSTETVSEAQAALVLSDVRSALSTTLEAVHGEVHALELKAPFRAA
ncbi:MAG: Hpt domain-containing protein [Pseudomonadota bacterium]